MAEFATWLSGSDWKSAMAKLHLGWSVFKTLIWKPAMAELHLGYSILVRDFDHLLILETHKLNDLWYLWHIILVLITGLHPIGSVCDPFFPHV
jgi:hypothetical protein